MTTTTDLDAAVAAAEAELARLRELRGDAERQLAAAKDGPSQAGAELAQLDELEVAVTLGELDAAELTARREAAAVRLEEAQASVRRWKALVAGLAPRIEQAEHAVKLARVNRDVEAYEPLERALATVGPRLLERLQAAAKEARTLARIRADIDEAAASVAAACAEAGVPAVLPPDEPSWSPDSIGDLLRVIAELGWGGGRAGEYAVVPAQPRTPRADAERSAQRAAEIEDRTRGEERRKLVEELAARSLSVRERLFDGEPVADVVSRVVDDAMAAGDLRSDEIEAVITEVMERRQVVIGLRLEEERCQSDHAGESWRRLGTQPPHNPLEETEVLWRLANEVPLDLDDVPAQLQRLVLERQAGAGEVDLDDEPEIAEIAFQEEAR